MPNFDTANNVLNDAAVELGLNAGDVVDTYASVDAAMVQLRRLLKGLGQDLTREFRWTHLQKTHVTLTLPVAEAYALPVDFGRLIDGTAWDRSNQLPLGGPLYAQNWQRLKAETSGGTVWLNFRLVGNRLALHPTPAAMQLLAYEYISRWWVAEDATSLPTSDTPDAATDVLHMDSRLLVAGLVLRFRTAKGFDTAGAQRAYSDALAAAQGGDGAAPTLSLTGCGGCGPCDGAVGVMGGAAVAPLVLPAVLDSGSILEIGGLL